jgi:phospholipid/cholesterol/gamma-HCH transport system substrate-binding protein
MNPRPNRSSLAASPGTVGAVTVIVVIVAVFLAYNANHGLPFVPTYKLSAEAPNAANLVNGNDVRIAGVRVGTVTSIVPTQGPNGQTAARLNLTLDKSLQPIPRDTTITVRNSSTIGLKYLQLNLGNSPVGFRSGDTIPMAQDHPQPVDLDQFFNTFDTPTREASQTNLRGFGDALAGRGGDLNGGITALRQLIDSAQPLVHNLAAPSTGFGAFWRSLESLSSTVAPVATQQAELFGGLDATFGAFARVARPYLQQTIEKGAPTEDAAIHSFPVMRPFLDDSATFFQKLQPGIHALAASAPDYATALTAGVPALRNSPTFDRELLATSQALLTFQSTPGNTNGLGLLSNTNTALDDPLAFIAPSQTICNYLALLFGNVASIGSSGDGIGTWSRVVTFTSAPGPNDQSSPSSAPANGPASVRDPGSGLPANYLHYNPYPNTAAPGQTRECEAGNEPYPTTQVVIGNPPGNQGTSTANQVLPHKKHKKHKHSKGKGK